MAYNQQLADRIREALAELPQLEEKEMFQGLTFLVNDKLCVCVNDDKLLCRFDPILHEQMAETNGFEEMVVNGRIYKGYGYIEPAAIRSQRQLTFWLHWPSSLTLGPKWSERKK